MQVFFGLDVIADLFSEKLFFKDLFSYISIHPRWALKFALAFETKDRKLI